MNMLKNAIIKGFKAGKAFAANKNVKAIASALAIGITLSYTQQAHAGAIADFFQEPINDAKSLLNDDLGNVFAFVGVLAGIATIIFTSYVMTGFTMVAGVVVLWGGLSLFQ